MADEQKIYRALPGRGTALASYIRLYEAPDHLLHVTSTGFSESYKRFYSRDIQAIVIRRTATIWIFTSIWFGCAMAFAIPMLAIGFEPVLAGFAGFFVLCEGINRAMGPTCVAHLRTAVQVEKLHTVRRLRSARRLLRRIRPRLEESQGKATSEDLGRYGMKAEAAASTPLANSPERPAGAQEAGSNVT